MIKSQLQGKLLSPRLCSPVCLLFYKHIPAVMEHLPSLKLTLISHIQTHSMSGRQRGLQQWSPIAIVEWGILYAYYIFKSSPASLVSSYRFYARTKYPQGQCTARTSDICISSETCVWETTAATNNSSKQRLTSTMSSHSQMATAHPQSVHTASDAYCMQKLTHRCCFSKSKSSSFSYNDNSLVTTYL